MKKYIKTITSALIIFLFSASLAYAISGGDTFVSQRDPTNTFNITRVLPLPASNAVVVMDVNTGLPTYGTLGTTLAFNSGTQSVDVATIAESNVTNLGTDLSSKANTSSLATVATSGSYTDLINTPSIPTAPASYQAIISETGTSAPTGTTLVNSYSGTPTLTWARTSAGVYTLTASTAIFNTSGRTGVFIQPLTNLNGAESAVVTSSTVITVTTAVQSLAVLGLLGFTATPTDALLNKTMIYVQTY